MLIWSLTNIAGYSEPSWDNKLNISYNAATTDDLRFSDEDEDPTIVNMKDEHSDDDDLPLSKVRLLFKNLEGITHLLLNDCQWWVWKS